MIHSLLFVIALSMDSFLAAFAYGTRNIRIPWYSALLIASIGTVMLGFSVVIASWIHLILPGYAGKVLSCGLFLVIGISTIFQEVIKSLLKQHRNKTLKFAYSGMLFVIDVYIDETKADRDFSKILSAKEAIYLAIALSFDSLLSGLAFGLDQHSLYGILSLNFLVSFLTLGTGAFLGTKVQTKKNLNLSWFSGCLFLLLGILRLF